MIKALIKYHILLCILLLSGYTQLSAHIFEENAFYYQINILNGSGDSTFENEELPHPSLVNFATSSSERNLLLEDTDVEEEEDERHSAKKKVERLSYFTSLFYVQHLESGFFKRYVKNHLSFCKYLHHVSSLSWYLVFEVFRI